MKTREKTTENRVSTLGTRHFTVDKENGRKALDFQGVPHCFFDGRELVAARRQVGISQAELAQHCGWSRQRQSALEIPGPHRISQDKIQTMNDALARFTI